MLRKITLLLLMALSFLLSAVSFALTPPRPGELQKYRNDGSYGWRIENAYRIGNHQSDSQLIQNMQRRLYELQGVPVPDGLLPAPPLAWRGGLPAFGSPKILVVLVDFSDQPHTAAQTTDDVQLKMFGAGNPADAPYESLRNFYQRSSYGQLNVGGTVLGWYRAANPRSYYQNLAYPNGNQALIKEALNYYNTQGHDFSQYDNDGNGVIDAFFIKWTGPDNGWANFWWAYQGGFYDSSYTIDGKRLGKFVWSWYYNPAWGDTAYKPLVDIHETGHLLGLPDYYDYDDTVGPRGGVGGLDMMNSNWGDHNSFSKFMLEWLTPTVITSGSETKVLNPSGTSADAVLIMPGATATTPFAEFFMGQYRKRNVGNDPNNYPTDGLILWHVDARLNSAGNDFQYDNSYTAHKLLRLMEADGLEEIERNIGANTGDFYLPPKTFGPGTAPNSNNYSGQSTGVIIDSLTTPGTTISARFAVGGSTCNYALSLTGQSFSAVGGSGTVNVTADTGCAWTAASTVNWITITNGNSGNGNGVVSYTVAINTTAERTGTLTIAGKTFDVVQAGGSGGTSPDLIITAVTSPTTGTVGGQIDVSWTIKNQGNQTATGSFWTSFFLSTDSIITTSDINMYWGCALDSLAPGNTYRCYGLMPVPTNVVPGTYYLGAYADTDGTITEGNETNNGLSASNQITITGSGGTSPDLIVTAVTSPTTGTAGGQIDVSWTVKNEGGQNAGEFWTLFYLSTDATITLDDINTGWGCSTTSLTAGESSGCGGLITIPTDVAAGTYYFGAYADIDSAIAESNETNNGLSAPNRITITGGGGQFYTLTLNQTGTGTGTISGSGNYASGSTVNLTAIANTGSTFNGWTPSPCAASFTMPASNLTCTATFTLGGDSATTLITHYYTSILERGPDAGGLAYWRDQIVQRQALGLDVKPVFRDMAFFFFNSAEYLARNTTDTQYITNLYFTFFQRAPDAGGMSFWLDELAKGMPRNTAMNGFLYSVEFTAFMQSLGF